MDTLHKHALEGFQGTSGVMPPKGGRADLADKSIINAVDYMVAGSK
jgi:cytochrome c